MLYATIRSGVGSPGKLWTGTEPVDGQAGQVLIIERKCPCGRTTRKFRVYPIDVSPEASEALTLPVVHVATGGVGSVATRDASELSKDLVCWNWAGREGGSVILNPLAVIHGSNNQPTREEVPPAKPGFRWLNTYGFGQSSLVEWVLVNEDYSRHVVPIVKLDGECPVCCQKRRLEALSAPVRHIADALQTRSDYPAECIVRCWGGGRGSFPEEELLAELRQRYFSGSEPSPSEEVAKVLMGVFPAHESELWNALPDAWKAFWSKVIPPIDPDSWRENAERLGPVDVP